jgi:hypothetical protein
MLMISGISFSQENVEKAEAWSFDVGARWIGVDLGVGYEGFPLFPDLKTGFWLYAGGGYEEVGYYHSPTDELYDGNLAGYDPETAPKYDRVNGRFDLGIVQGLLPVRENIGSSLELFLFYKLRYDAHLADDDANQLIYNSSLPDKDGILQNSLLVGTKWHDISTNHHHHLISGSEAELSIEWGPEGFFNTKKGLADFVRFNLSAKVFLPLIDINPENLLNIFSMYLGTYFSVDYTAGKYIPLNIVQTFGGRTPRNGLGGAMRGVEDCRFDAPFKIVANVELRINMPALSLWGSELMPGIVFYFDSGYYNFLDSGGSEFLFSTGAGIYLSLLNMMDLVFYTNFFLNGTKVDGNQWTPLSFAFGFHY